MSFYPPDEQEGVDRKSQVITALVGPIAGHCVLAFGIMWWVWDLYVLPNVGYIFKAEEKKIDSEKWGTKIVNVHFTVSKSNP